MLYVIYTHINVIYTYIHIYMYIYIYDVIYILYLGPLHFLKKRCPKVDYKSTASYNDS